MHQLRGARPYAGCVAGIAVATVGPPLRGIGREALPVNAIRCGAYRRQDVVRDHPGWRVGSVRGSPRIRACPGSGRGPLAGGARVPARAVRTVGSAKTLPPAWRERLGFLGEGATWSPAWGVPNPASPSCGLPVNYIAARGGRVGTLVPLDVADGGATGPQGRPPTDRASKIISGDGEVSPSGPVWPDGAAGRPARLRRSHDLPTPLGAQPRPRGVVRRGPEIARDRRGRSTARG